MSAREHEIHKVNSASYIATVRPRHAGSQTTERHTVVALPHRKAEVCWRFLLCLLIGCGSMQVARGLALRSVRENDQRCSDNDLALLGMAVTSPMIAWVWRCFSCPSAGRTELSGQYPLSRRVNQGVSSGDLAEAMLLMEATTREEEKRTCH